MQLAIEILNAFKGFVQFTARQEVDNSIRCMFSVTKSRNCILFSEVGGNLIEIS